MTHDELERRVRELLDLDWQSSGLGGDVTDGDGDSSDAAVAVEHQRNTGTPEVTSDAGEDATGSDDDPDAPSGSEGDLDPSEDDVERVPVEWPRGAQVRGEVVAKAFAKSMSEGHDWVHAAVNRANLWFGIAGEFEIPVTSGHVRSMLIGDGATEAEVEAFERGDVEDLQALYESAKRWIVDALETPGMWPILKLASRLEGMEKVGLTVHRING